MRRRSVRVLLLDERERVLLVRFRDGDRTWWCTPGGGVEGDETDVQTAARELREEVGLGSVELGPCIWLRHHAGVFRGVPFDQEERIHIARTRSFTPRPGTETPLEHPAEDIRWWTVDELATTSDDLTPRDLARLMRSVLDNGPPMSPIGVGE